MRLILLLADNYDNTNNLTFDTYKIQEYSHLLNKIRNASRYVYSKYIAVSNKKIKIKTLIDSIENNTTDYDLWIIHSIKSILDDYEYQL
jgi:valyl-tRNA synthetase